MNRWVLGVVFWYVLRGIDVFAGLEGFRFGISSYTASLEVLGLVVYWMLDYGYFVH